MEAEALVKITCVKDVIEIQRYFNWQYIILLKIYIWPLNIKD